MRTFSSTSTHAPTAGMTKPGEGASTHIRAASGSTVIDYRDDPGFWAFGKFTGGTLQHGGFTFHRA